ncbi:arginase family protein [Bacillus suaedaesalsae]|uniref:Arginase family protein n=1 Tax=Bacillus suaedaesalsae TaxID=2810349 RepID=A0ABS2DKF9_9BACI|nr:arginase family protein [Bacillus suaedaesalsae]MBM6618953.1 arginase family protein [Bacillus suaedaesalsae]
MKVNVVGVPTNMGALFSGTELSPMALREAGLISKLEEVSEVTDYGDITLPNFLPRHNTPPIRHYPGPRLVWEELTKAKLFEENVFSLILGGDCSIIVGTTTNLTEKFGEDVHVIVIDAHVDDVAPEPENCVGAAAMGLWFLTHANIFWPKHLSANNFTVIGCQTGYTQTAVDPISLPLLRQFGIHAAVQRVLEKCGKDTKILLHLDVDVINEKEMPAAYSPSKEGLTYQECSMLLKELLKDPRLVGLEVTEFSALKDDRGIEAEKLVNFIVNTIASKRELPAR